MSKRELKTPIMSEDTERFMAYCGVIQWAQAIVRQSKRINETDKQMFSGFGKEDPFKRTKFAYQSHCEQHYYVIAAYKFVEYCKWARELRLFADVDFSEVEPFCDDKQEEGRALKDLRNMREHVVNYFRGEGFVRERWFIETPEFSADASSRVSSMIGGRLDFVKFTSIIEQLLPSLLKEPIPFPEIS